MSLPELPSAPKKAKVDHCEKINKCIYNELNALPIVQHILRAHNHCVTDKNARKTCACSTRAYEEEYLRECGIGERPCCMQQQCEGLQLFVPQDMRCILRQYDIPDSTAESCNMCLLCLRKHVLSSMLQATTNAQNINCTHTPIYNLMDVPGEYCLKDTILCDVMQLGCAYVPVVAHRRSAYVTERVDGILHVKQLYDKPDFCSGEGSA